jgi:hypothetical protein
MHPQLAQVADDLRAAIARLEALATRVTPEAWARRPEPGRWSAAECAAHLDLTAAAYLPPLDEALAEARRHGGGYTGRYRRDVVGWLLWRSLDEAATVRMPTSAAFVPGATASPADEVREFRRLHEALVARVEAADGLRIDRVRMPSPFNPRLRYRAWSGLSILPRHAHRHLRQAEAAAGISAARDA